MFNVTVASQNCIEFITEGFNSPKVTQFLMIYDTLY